MATNLAQRRVHLSHHVRAIRALDRVVVKAAARGERVERSESLDDGEASATIRGVMADPADVKPRTAEARFSGWIHATNSRSCA
jgi:hypothetical protein